MKVTGTADLEAAVMRVFVTRASVTRSLLAREPACPGLLDDLAHGEFCQGTQ
jgi:hypothetical protein